MDAKIWTAVGAIGSLLAGIGAIWAVTNNSNAPGQGARLQPPVADGNPLVSSTPQPQPQQLSLNNRPVPAPRIPDPALAAEAEPITPMAESASAVPGLSGRWIGTVSWKEGSHWWDFRADGTFLESEGYTGVWSQSGTQVIWTYPRGTRYEAEIRGGHLSGRRFRQKGEFGGTFTLGRID